MKKIILIFSILFSAQTLGDDLFENLLSNLGAPLAEIGFVEKSTTSIDGVNIIYYDKGTGDKTLLFIHGYGCNSKYWWAQLQHFSKDYRVISIDIGGHGESGINRDNYTMTNFGADVVAVMNEENIQQSYLIGHSMGGPVALEAAVVLQDRVTAIIGVDTFHNIAKGPASPFVKLLVNTMFKFRQSSATNDAVTKQFRDDANLDLKNWITNKSEAIDPRASRGSLSSIIAMDYPTQLKKINVPIITLNSKYWMETEVEEGQKEYSKYEVNFIDGVGHYVMMEKPTYFNNWLDGVLNESTVN